jgi:hypothetical protein
MSLKTPGGHVKRQTSLTKLRSFMALRALIFSSSILTIVPTVFAVDATPGVEQIKSVKTLNKDEKSENQLMKKAMRVIKKTIKRANGTPYFISCRYKIKDNKPVAASTEVRYLDYRKKSDSRSVELEQFDGKVDRIVDFVYKPNLPKTLAVVHRDPINLMRRLASKKISLDL